MLCGVEHCHVTFYDQFRHSCANAAGDDAVKLKVCIFVYLTHNRNIYFAFSTLIRTVMICWYYFGLAGYAQRYRNVVRSDYF